MSKEETRKISKGLSLRQKMKIALFQKSWEDSYLSPIMKERLENALNVCEEEVNKKVLETLEREVKVAFETGYNNALNNCEYFDGADVPSLTSDEEEYYETEVKPRYQNTNKID